MASASPDDSDKPAQLLLGLEMRRMFAVSLFTHVVTGWRLRDSIYQHEQVNYGGGPLRRFGPNQATCQVTTLAYFPEFRSTGSRARGSPGTYVA